MTRALPFRLTMECHFSDLFSHMASAIRQNLALSVCISLHQVSQTHRSKSSLESYCGNIIALLQRDGKACRKIFLQWDGKAC